MRLTNDDRSIIARRVVTTAYTDRLTSSLEEGFQLAEKVLDTVMTPAERRHVEALPAKFWSRAQDVSFSYSRYGLTAHCASMNVKLDADDAKSSDYSTVPLRPGTKLPPFIKTEAHLVADQALWAAIMEWRRKDGELEEEIKAFAEKTRGTLAAFSNSAKLLAAWPTLRDVMNDRFFDDAPKVQLPMTTINELDVTLKAGLKEAA